MSAGLDYLSAAIHNGAGPAIMRLQEHYMIDERERTVYNFVTEYYRRYREVPAARIVSSETGIRLRTINEPLQFHHDQLLDRHDFNILRANYEPLRDSVQEGDTAQAVEIMDSTIRQIRRSRRGNVSAIDAVEGIQQVTDRLDRVMGMGGMSGVETPWEYMNEQTGGYQESDIITYVARTGQGKTALLINQADAAYESGSSALIITTEMNSEQIIRRWLTQKYGLNPRDMKLGTISTYLRRRLDAYATELLGRERFRVLPLGTGASFKEVEAAIDEFAPEIVFIDGIYLFRPSIASGNMKLTERVTAVYDDLKQLSIDSRLPYVVNTQFNRQAGKGGKEGSIETIGLSDAIGWHSSIVVAVKPGPTENPQMSRELDFLKGREGEAGKFYINFKFRPVDFSEIPREEVAEMIGGPALNSEEEDWE